jgi:hypothetical protein
VLSRECDVGAWVLLCRPKETKIKIQFDRLTTKLVSSYALACVLCMEEGGWGWMGVRDLVCVE